MGERVLALQVCKNNTHAVSRVHLSTHARWDSAGSMFLSKLYTQCTTYLYLESPGITWNYLELFGITWNAAVIWELYGEARPGGRSI